LSTWKKNLNQTHFLLRINFFKKNNYHYLDKRKITKTHNSP
jgi:hypothetical protein